MTDPLVLDDTEDDIDAKEEYVLPGDLENFQFMRDILFKVLNKYIKEHEAKRYTDFLYIDFHFESEIIQIKSGGSVFMMKELAVIVIQIGYAVLD